MFWLSSAALMAGGTFWKKKFVQHELVLKFYAALTSICAVLLKLGSKGIDLQSSGLLWWMLGASWICIPLFNSNFLESRHPLSSHLCVYSDTQSLAHWNQSSWLMMRMRVCVTCVSCTEGASVSFCACLHLRVSLCVWFSVCADCQRKHIGRDWHSYFCRILCER